MLSKEKIRKFVIQKRRYNPCEGDDIYFEYDMEGLAKAQEKDTLSSIPFKRTIIGEERSMPEGTVIWFITDDEKKSLGRREVKE